MAFISEDDLRGGGVIGGVGSASIGGAYGNPGKERTQRQWNPYEKLSMRMGWPFGDLPEPFSHVNIAHKPAGGYLVFIVVGNNHVVLEDGEDLFPSDTLIGKMRLLGP